LCYPPFSQVGSDRRCSRETLSYRPGKRSLSPPPADAHEPSHRLAALMQRQARGDASCRRLSARRRSHNPMTAALVQCQLWTRAVDACSAWEWGSGAQLLRRLLLNSGLSRPVHSTARLPLVRPCCQDVPVRVTGPLSVRRPPPFGRASRHTLPLIWAPEHREAAMQVGGKTLVKHPPGSRVVQSL
jgi:hypothetical protein